ncbi:MAG: DMT family transporter [Saprospiraceae bacterium]|nr:DMT family transporter [Saprospiraceae bacterium]
MKNLMNWGLFLILTLIWGSSFILMKEGLVKLSAYQVAAMRIFSSGMVLLPMALRAFRNVTRSQIKYIVLSASVGSFIPAFLFCIAEEHINSSLAGIVNALSPLFTILIGVLFYQMKMTRQKIGAVIVGFVGLCLLFISKDGLTFDKSATYSLLVVLATIGYGWNGNILARHLGAVGSVNIAAIAYTILGIPAFFILLTTGYFNNNWSDTAFLKASGAAAILGIVGTAIAQILFYMLLKRTNVVFAALVTYTIPFVAILWGVWYGETITAMQIACLLLILSGVYVANRPNKR